MSTRTSDNVSKDINACSTKLAAADGGRAAAATKQAKLSALRDAPVALPSTWGPLGAAASRVERQYHAKHTGK
jgi:hypothetical protein